MHNLPLFLGIASLLQLQFAFSYENEREYAKASTHLLIGIFTFIGFTFVCFLI